MTLSPEIEAKIRALHLGLEALDPILYRFCQANGYRFTSLAGAYPRRKVWMRAEVDRTMDLVTDLTVQEIMDRGFYPEMPWSLYATASFSITSPSRFITLPVFEHLPFSQIVHELPHKLEEARNLLNGITKEDILTKGQTHG